MRMAMSYLRTGKPGKISEQAVFLRIRAFVSDGEGPLIDEEHESRPPGLASTVAF